jgi:hypothetical protein
MFGYDQSTGRFTQDESLLEVGYSGHGEGRNNPLLEWCPNRGPIPRGLYEIEPAFDDPEGKGPVVFRLKPVGHSACGRTGFMIHGDNERHDASLGCIILYRNTRKLIEAERLKGNRLLLVT